MHAAFETAGFTDVRTATVDAPLRLPSAAACARFQREAFAGLDQMLFAFAPAARDAIWAEVADALRSLERDGHFESPAQFIVGSGGA